MTRKLVTIRTINALNPIEGADVIEQAVVDGWKLVVKKCEFKVGDTCVYFEIDSFLPETDSRYAFLMKSGVREFEGACGHKLRTIKLRGTISQGLALPLNLFPELSNASTDTDFADILGIKKWEPTISASMAGQVKGSFPSFIKKTDQERCQNIGHEIFGYTETYEAIDISNIPADTIDRLVELGDLKQDGDSWLKVHKAKADINDQYEVTVKLDGSSVTYYHYNSVIGVCSRNLELKINDENKDNSLVKLFINSGLMNAITMLGNVAIQGELMGPGIQGNREQFKDTKFFIFDIQNLDSGEYLTPIERQEMTALLANYGVKIDLVSHVPVVAYSAKLFDTLGIKDVDGLLRFAEGKSINHTIREGVVFKRLDGKFSFKAISNLFLSKEKD